MSITAKLLLTFSILTATFSIVRPVWTVLSPSGERYAAPPSIDAYLWDPPENPPSTPGKVTIDYGTTIVRGLAIVFMFYLVVGLFQMAYFHYETHSPPLTKVLIYSIGVPLILALLGGFMAGTESSSDFDPFPSGNYEVVGNPSFTERFHIGLRIFICIFTPAILGTLTAIIMKKRCRT